MKLSYALIMVMLLHSFFSCAQAVGHVDDPLHSVDSVFDSDHDLSRDVALLFSSSVAQPDACSSASDEHDHQHSFHAHVSCLVGYQVGVNRIPSVFASNNKLFVQGRSVTLQPPVPPPNHNFSI